MNVNGRPTLKFECPDCRSFETLVTAGNSTHQKGLQYRRHICKACGNKWSSKNGFPYFPRGREMPASEFYPKIVTTPPQMRQAERGLTWTITAKQKPKKVLRWTNEIEFCPPETRPNDNN